MRRPEPPADMSINEKVAWQEGWGEGLFAQLNLLEPSDEMVDALGRYMNPGKWWDEPELWKGSIALYREQARDMIAAVLGAVESA